MHVSTALLHTGTQLLCRLCIALSPGPFPVFSACNIEKLGMGLGTRLDCVHIVHTDVIVTHKRLACGNHYYRPPSALLGSVVVSHLDVLS